MTGPLNLPAFLGPPTVLPSPRRGLKSLWLEVSAEQNALRGFTIQDQAQSLWCWAAVGLSVRQFYVSGSPLTQCGVASMLPHGEPATQLDCCGAQRNRCNNAKSLKTVLTQLGHLAEPNVDGSSTFQRVKAEVDAQRPLCARICEDGSPVGHFVVLSGYRLASGREYVTVHDPANNGASSNVRAEMPLAEFNHFYWGGSSEWTHTYVTTG